MSKMKEKQNQAASENLKEFKGRSLGEETLRRLRLGLEKLG